MRSISDRCTALLATSHVSEHLPHVCLADQSTHSGSRVQRVSRIQPRDFLDEKLQQLRLDGLVNEQARAGRAHLSLIPERAGQNGVRDCVEIRAVVENYVRRLAAALE